MKKGAVAGIILLLSLIAVVVLLSIVYPVLPGLFSGKARILNLIEGAVVSVNGIPEPEALVFQALKGFKGELYQRFYLMIPQEREELNYLLIIDTGLKEIGFPYETGKKGFSIISGKYLLQSYRGDLLHTYYKKVNQDVSYDFSISGQEISFQVPYGTIFTFEGKRIRISLP